MNIVKPPLNSKQKEIIAAVASDLNLITNNIPNIEIVVRGGFIPDLLYGTEARDIDLFYCIKNSDGLYSTSCHCDEIRARINILSLKFIGKRYEFDLENSFEKEPRLAPIPRTVGFFSYHTDWLSMFCLDIHGDIWTNNQTYDYFNKRTFEVRYLGKLAWAYYPRPTDSNNYYVAFICQIIRDLSHIHRRKLIMGEQFQELLSNAGFIFKKTLEVDQSKRAFGYFKKKFKDLDTFKTAVEELDIKNRREIIDGIVALSEKHKSD